MVLRTRNINVSLPTSSARAEPGPVDPTPKADLNLTVQISDKGFIIAASGAVLYQGQTIDAAGNLTAAPAGATLPTIPKKGNDFDYEGLARTMSMIKASPTAKNETKVIVNANPEVVYDVIVQVLDACRGKTIPVPDPDHPGKMMEGYERFGDVLLSAGLN